MVTARFIRSFCVIPKSVAILSSLVMKIITWSGEGFITELKSETQIDVDAECIEFDKYLELLKFSFYSV